MKNRNAIASYLMTVPGILAVAAIILYTRVMYTMAPVYFMLGGVIVLVALGFVIARKFPRISNYIPVCVSVLLASAAVWGSELMVNQIGYVVAGLDGVETIISWIVYLTLVIIALIVSLVASFLPMTKPETDPAVLAAQTAAGRKKIGRILTAALAVLLAAAIACTCIFYNQASGLRKQLATVTSEAASTKASLESKLNDAEGRASRLQSQVAGMFTQADVDQKVAEAVEAAKAEFQAAMPAAETAQEPAIDYSALPFAPVFAPNEAYDEFTTVAYTIEDIGAELACTVSRKADGSEYYVECNFYGDDQMTRTSYDGNEFVILEDKTGFMGGNTPDILKKAMDQNIWLPIHGATPAAAEPAADPASALPFAPVFAPNEAYDEYTTVPYTIEDIGAELECTVSRKADGSEYYLECNFYGDDQMTRTTYDGSEFTILEDKTGFMGGNTPDILKKAMDQNIWLPIHGDAPAAAAPAAEPAADPAFALPFAPVFAPNAAYDEYTTVPYTIEDIGAELECTVSRKADGSEYYLECNFYGDDQMTRTTYDGSEFTILEDKTGFMGGNTPDILKKAIEQNIWLPIAK